MEPITAGDNTATTDDRTDASDPCRPQTAGGPSYMGPTGCLGQQPNNFTPQPGAPNPPGSFDPNCFSPNQVSLGLLYATTEECRPNLAPYQPGPNSQPLEGVPNETDGTTNQPTGDRCRSNQNINLQSLPPAEGDGVKARAGVADLFLTSSSGTNPTSPVGDPPNDFLHVSGINSFAEVTCRLNPGAGQPGNNPNHPANVRIPFWDARSQVVYVAGGFGTTFVGLDIVPGLIPGTNPSQLNTYREAGPFRFNVTYVNDNEMGGPVGPDEGFPVGTPNNGQVQNLNTYDADPDMAGHQPVTKVTQRAVDINNGAIVAGEATVDVTQNPCGPRTQTPPKIVIKKVTSPQPDATAFNFSGPGANNYSLSHGGTAEFSSLATGNYTVTEEDKAGYEESVSCDDPSGNTTTSGRTANIALGNETVTCTFTNKKDGVNGSKIVIRKNTVPNDPQDFSFSGSGTIGTFQLDDDGNNANALPRERSFNVAPGGYTVSEGTQSGFTLQSVRCSDPTGNSSGNTGTRTATIDVAANETVTCTFTNKKNNKKKPVKCDRDDDGWDDRDKDHDGWDDRDKNHDGWDDRDKNHDGRDDRNGKNLRRTDRNGDGKDDECERDRKERKKCSDGHRRAKKADGDDRGRKDDDRGGRKKGERDDDRKHCRNKKSKKSKR